MKHILTLITVLLLAGCMGSSGSAWNQGPSAPAQAGPNTLAAPGEQVATGPVMNEVPVTAQEPVRSTSSTIKVALLVPLSGPQADKGQALLNAAQLALFDLGSHSFELMPRDTGSTPEGAEKAVRKAIDDGARLILGPLFAPQVRAAAPIAGQAGINLIAFSTDWSLAGGNTYIMGFVPFGQVQRIVEYASSQGLRRIAVLAPSDEYGNAVMNAYNSRASSAGITTVDVVRFPPNRADLTDVLTKFAANDDMTNKPDAVPPYDAVLIAAGGNQARTLANGLMTYGLGPNKVRRLGTGLWDEAKLAVEPGMQNAWFAAPSPDLRRTFEKRYADTYSQKPLRIATLAYDATALAAILARNGDPDPFNRTALTNPNGFAGVDGVFRFLPNGLAERGLGVLTFSGGRIDVQDQAPKTFQQWQSQ